MRMVFAASHSANLLLLRNSLFGICDVSRTASSKKYACFRLVAVGIRPTALKLPKIAVNRPPAHQAGARGMDGRGGGDRTEDLEIETQKSLKAPWSI